MRKNSSTIDLPEMDSISNNKDYSYKFDKDIGSIMELKRSKLAPGMNYTMSWKLPSESEIYAE